MLSFLSGWWTNTTNNEQESDDPPPPYPVAVTREEVLSHVKHIEAQLKLLLPSFPDREGPINLYIKCLLSDMEDVKRLCTDDSAEQFDHKLIPILPHLSELKTIKSTGCPTVIRFQIIINQGYTRKLWLDLLRLILTFDPEAKASRQTRIGTLYGREPKKQTYSLDEKEGEESVGHIEGRAWRIERLWPSWPELSPLVDRSRPGRWSVPDWIETALPSQ